MDDCEVTLPACIRSMTSRWSVTLAKSRAMIDGYRCTLYVTIFMEMSLRISTVGESRCQSQVPTRATEGSAGLDVMARVAARIEPGETSMVYTGIKVAPPPGYVTLLFPRSGLSHRGLMLTNGVGVIDPDYRGEVKLSLYNRSAEAVDIRAGDRVGQLVLVPYIAPAMEVVSSLDDTARGEGGHGSTGR